MFWNQRRHAGRRAGGRRRGGATVSFEKVKRGGIGATRYHVQVQEEHVHRHLSHIVKLIEKAGRLTNDDVANGYVDRPYRKQWDYQV
jgi:hypothetical protein